MSIQFGTWNFDGQPPTPDYIEKVSATLAPYGPDSNESHSKGGIKILYRAFHTTKESRREVQPHVSSSGAVITWDGRLDNRAKLISALQDVNYESTDLAIIAAAYETWGINCFAKLIGDWTLSIWNPVNRSLILAKDPIGARHLYYSFDAGNVTWSTILDPLVLFAGKTFELCEEYIAGWLAIMFPAAHLTPYVGIYSVPPSSFVLLRPGTCTTERYWDFDPSKTIRYRTDGEYEEHFRSVLAAAVQRSLRSDRPVLAELSGGMDSSAIVCIADNIIARGAPATSRLDTISWYDDTYDQIEPDMNERPYFSRVEQKRGHVGYHIDLGTLRARAASQDPFNFESTSDRFPAIPDSIGPLPEIFKQYAGYMTSSGHRVTISGIGGGEVTGDGVPTPTPELQNLLATACLFTFVRQLNAWAAKMRRPRLALFWEAVRGFLYRVSRDESNSVLSFPWLDSGFMSRNMAALDGYPSRVQLFGPLPSLQHNLRSLAGDRRLLANWTLHPEFLREVRLPYFDRDLLEFMYGIPREQIVRVGQRRSLMKRALAGVVPDELLNRKRKAAVQQQSFEDPPVASLIAMAPKQTVSSSQGIIEHKCFSEYVRKARDTGRIPYISFKRTLTLELWLRHLVMDKVLLNSPMEMHTCSFSLGAKESQNHGEAPCVLR